jgi:hypothetical protein
MTDMICHKVYELLMSILNLLNITILVVTILLYHDYIGRVGTTSLIIPTTLLEVVKSLFQTC